MKQPDFLRVGEFVKVAGFVGVIDYIAEKNGEITVKVISPKAASRMQPNNCDWLVYNSQPGLWQPATREDFAAEVEHELERVKRQYEAFTTNTKKIATRYV